MTPILRHHEKMHTRFAMSGAGNTPLDSALWWTVQELHPMRESRKMILIITDGQSDNPQLAQTAITEARRLGLEVYGIGIANASILSLLPDTSIVINSRRASRRSGALRQVSTLPHRRSGRERSFHVPHGGYWVE